MRCDETKPFCHNCLKNGGNCGYRGSDSVESSTVNSPTADSSSVLLSQALSGPFVIDPLKSVVHTQISSAFEQPNLSPAKPRVSQLLSIEQLALPSTSELLGVPRASYLENLPIALSPKSRMLLHHLDNYRILLPDSVGKNPGDKITIMAVSDPGILHAALVLAAEHWILLGGQKSAIENTLNNHKMEAIRIVNDNLGNPATAICDSTCLHGSVETAAIHFKGLGQIVRMRGDLHAGSMNDLLQKAILLSDVLIAISVRSQPHFQETYVSRHKHLTDSSQLSEVSKLDLHWLDEQLFSNTNCVDSDIARMFGSLQWQSNFMATTDFECPEENSILNRAIDETEAFIEELIQSRASSTLRSGVCIQAGDELSDTGFDYFANPLKDELENFQHTGDAFPLELWFWILFVGASAALGRPERQRFMAELQITRDKLMLGSWVQAKRRLRKFAWVDGWNEVAHMNLWNQFNIQTIK
ncbi:hypothetical protein IFR05_014330 [Cadophora sp. M221]|nr:hypothetical protein IFR05_014330 [Cadophora sp. M221]